MAEWNKINKIRTGSTMIVRHSDRKIYNGQESGKKAQSMNKLKKRHEIRNTPGIRNDKYTKK